MIMSSFFLRKHYSALAFTITALTVRQGILGPLFSLFGTDALRTE